MFQTLSYIGILISELAQRTARRGSRNATKRRSKITYSVMTLAAKPTHNNQKRRANRTFAERFTLIVKYRSASHASTRIIPTITHTCSECPLLRMSSGRAAQLTCAQPRAPVLRATSTYYATLRTAARSTGIRLQRAAPPGNGESFSLAMSTNSSALLHPRRRKCHLRHIFAQHP